MASQRKSPKNEPPTFPGGPSGNEDYDEGVDCKKSGKMSLDATCAPADIQYPTDTRILNEAREKYYILLLYLFSPADFAQFIAF